MKPGKPGEGANGGTGAPARRRAWQSPGATRPGKPKQPSHAPPATQALPVNQAAETGSQPRRPAPAGLPTQAGAAARKSAGVRGSASAAAPTFAASSTADRPRASAAPPAPEPVPQGSHPARGAAFRRFRVPSAPRGPALISRGERALFWALLASVLAMSIFLVRYRERVDAHFQARAMAVPLASAGAAPAPLLLYLANDDTGALTERPLAFPLPGDPNTRARVVLEKLLSEYTAPGSPHPLQPAAPGVEGVDEVYLSPVPGQGRGTLAVVDLTPNFVHTHPSGIEPETLTLLSMIATLHANLPSVTEVRFLVDGEPRPTLAGHADLSRTYLAGAAQMAPSEAFTTRPVQP